MPFDLASRLLDWYGQHGRRLPWRGARDPYEIWVSEIMLQQTRVETVIPYFQRWLRAFPTVKALAAASEQDVLNVWEGLGYYSRARNLHRAARILAAEDNGTLPRDLAGLRALPGIGRYTAGAIASMAYAADEPTLDANIRRVLARLFNVEQPADSPAGENRLWELARSHLPKGRAGDFNQALMDLGAMICLPKNPRCLICPLMDVCEARKLGLQEQRPVLKPKKPVPHFVHAAGVIIQRSRVLLALRPSKGLLGGMWEFPNGRVEGDPARGLKAVLQTGYRLKVRREAALGVVEHAYTHFRVTVHAFRCAALEPSRGPNLKWVRLKELEEYPMGKIDRQIARRITTETLKGARGHR